MYFYECYVEYFGDNDAHITERMIVCANSYAQAAEKIEDYYGRDLIAVSIHETEHEDVYVMNDESFAWTAPQYKEKENV